MACDSCRLVGEEDSRQTLPEARNRLCTRVWVGHRALGGRVETAQLFSLQWHSLNSL